MNIQARVVQFIHDFTILFGVVGYLFWVGVAFGYITGIVGPYHSERVFAFNTDGKDYIQKGR